MTTDYEDKIIKLFLNKICYDVPNKYNVIIPPSDDFCKCLSNIKTTDKIGIGGHGIVMEISCDINGVNTSFARKDVYFRMDKSIPKNIIPINKESFIKEINIQYMCSKKSNLCPKILASIICDYGGFIIMEKMDITIHQRLFNILEDENKYEEMVFYMNIINLYKNLLFNLTQLHKINIFHGDIKLDNIMLFNNKIKFIDFGKSSNIVTKENILLDIKMLESSFLYDIQLFYENNYMWVKNDWEGITELINEMTDYVVNKNSNIQMTDLDNIIKKYG